MRADIVRFQHLTRLEQKLRLVISIKFHADIGKQAHRLNMVTVALQECATQLLGLVDAPFLNKARDAQQLSRKGRQMRILRMRKISWPFAPSRIM